MTSPQASRYDWIDYAKGICITAVVMLYSANEALAVLGGAGWMQYWVDFARPFRMPDFFLLSGLFLARVIDKPIRHYLDRKVLHYLYFFVLWTSISLVLRVLTGDLNEGALGLLKSYISMLVLWPFHQLWFILMLPIYFLVTRCTRRVPVWVMFPLACILQIFPYHFETSILKDFGERFVFFYAGYAFAPLFFSMAEKVRQRPYISLLALALWILINSYLVFNGYSKILPVTLVLGFAGACAIMSIASLLQNISGFLWLRYLGHNSIVIYLPFYWVMMAASFCITRWLPPLNAGFFTLIITFLGIIGSLFLFWIVGNRTLGAWLFARPKWLRIAP